MEIRPALGTHGSRVRCAASVPSQSNPASVLSEFRTRLLAGAAEYLRFDTLLSWCRDRQLVKAGGRQRTDSPHILAVVRALNRIEVVGETLRHALNSLAVVVPEWKARYARRAEDDRLPTTPAACAALALTIGHDGWQLLSAIDHDDTPPWLREVPAVVAMIRHPVRQQGMKPTRPVVISSKSSNCRVGERQKTCSWIQSNV